MRSVFEEQARAKGIELEVDECEDVVRTDRGLLERIVENLVSNAIRYTHRGAVSLRCLHEPSLVKIEVADTGIGIPMEEIDLVFDEFYQSTQKGGAKKEGLGLGLAIVQRLAALLQHEIRIDSAPGVGTRFAVEVPRGAGSEPAVAGDVARPESTARAFAILLVDDDPAVVDATSLFLSLDGHSVQAAGTLEEALEIVKKESQLDLLVTDYHLGGEVTGFQVIEEVRREMGRTVPSILVTGDTSSAVEEKTAGVERCGTLNKPVDPDALVEKIGELLA